MPRWVKVFIIVAIVLALAFIVTQLLGVQHGPGLHNPGGSGSSAAPMEHVQT
jgi:preprotein translocase subunit SecG